MQKCGKQQTKLTMNYQYIPTALLGIRPENTRYTSLFMRYEKMKNEPNFSIKKSAQFLPENHQPFFKGAQKTANISSFFEIFYQKLSKAMYTKHLQNILSRITPQPPT